MVDDEGKGIPRDYVMDGRRRGKRDIEIYCSDPDNTNNNWNSSIRSSDVLGWKDLKAEIGGCSAGFKMRWAEESCYEHYHDDHHWYPEGKREFLDIKPPRHSGWFVGAGSPLLTRIGSSSSFGW